MSTNTLTPIEIGLIESQVVEAAKSVYDPEIPVNVYDLGLIYDVDIDEDMEVAINMTLTSPACPAAQSLPPEVEQKAASVEGITDAKVTIVWEPPWTMDSMSEEAKLELGIL